MIAAIILAAGQSRRMGRNKMLLPFGATTVIKTLVDEVAACEPVRDIVVVTGHEHEQIEAALSESPARCVFNPDYARAEMLTSLQVGLRAMRAETRAALIALGDQPRLQRAIVQRVIDAYAPDALAIPSFQMKRGHPILIARLLWPEVLSLPPTATLRDFIHVNEVKIRYVEVDDDSVIRDIDTPEDYQALAQPAHS